MDHITNHVSASVVPVDIWTLYDAPHIEAVKNVVVCAAFMRSASTTSVSCHSMFGTIAVRVEGPDGGKVTFNAVREYLEPGELSHLMQACREARDAGKLTEGRLPSDATLQESL